MEPGLAPALGRRGRTGKGSSAAEWEDSSGVGMGDGGVLGCKRALCGRVGARVGRRAGRGVVRGVGVGRTLSRKGEREGRRERERERGLGHRLRRQGASKAFGSGKRAPVTRFRLPCGGRKKALPESRQGLFDASETEITPCLRQCSRRCGRFPVLHRWE